MSSITVNFDDKFDDTVLIDGDVFGDDSRKSCGKMDIPHLRRLVTGDIFKSDHSGIPSVDVDFKKLNENTECSPKIKTITQKYVDERKTLSEKASDTAFDLNVEDSEFGNSSDCLVLHFGLRNDETGYTHIFVLYDQINEVYSLKGVDNCDSEFSFSCGKSKYVCAFVKSMIASDAFHAGQLDQFTTHTVAMYNYTNLPYKCEYITARELLTDDDSYFLFTPPISNMGECFKLLSEVYNEY
jgi:hypothetical protein